jgi:hypothetical protein
MLKKLRANAFEEVNGAHTTKSEGLQAIRIGSESHTVQSSLKSESFFFLFNFFS